MTPNKEGEILKKVSEDDLAFMKGVLGGLVEFDQRPISGSLLRAAFQVEEIITALKDRVLTVVGVKFTDECDLANLDLPFSLNFYQCTFRVLSLRGSQVNSLLFSQCDVESLFAESCQCRGDMVLTTTKLWWLHLNDAKINGSLRCEECRFGGTRNPISGESPGVGIELLGDRLSVGGDLKLLSSRFFDVVVVRGGAIGGSVDITDCRCRGWRGEQVDRLDPEKPRYAVIFLDSTIGRSLSFHGSCIAGCIAIRGTSIGGTLNFRDTRISSSGQKAIDGGWVKVGNGVVAEGMITNGLIHLPQSVVQGEMLFDGARFLSKPGRKTRSGLHLSDSRIGTYLSLSDLSLGEFNDLLLNDTTCDSLVISSRTIEKEGCDTGLSGLKMRSVWMKSSDRKDLLPSLLRILDADRSPAVAPYRQFAAALESHGYESEATRLRVAGEWRRLKKGQGSWASRTWGWLYGAIVGFGFQPGRAIPWALAVLLVGAIVFDFAHTRGILVTRGSYSDNEYVRAESRKIDDRFVPITYSADLLLPSAPFGTKDKWDILPPKNCLPNGPAEQASECREYARLLSAYRLFHIFAGWILVTTGIAAVANWMRRKG